MARRLILDTGIIIRAERNGAALSAEFEPEDDMVIAAISAAELFAGIELASRRDRAKRQTFVDGILEIFPVEPYDVAIARAHAKLIAHTQRTGTPRGANDLVIAATAAATKRTLVTIDRAARFGELPGVEALLLGLD